METSLLQSLEALFFSIGTGKALVVISAVVTVLMQVIKQPMVSQWMSKAPGWVHRLAPVFLGVLGGFLSHFSNGFPWDQALVAGFGGGYIAASHHQVAKGVAGAAKAAVGMEG